MGEHPEAEDKYIGLTPSKQYHFNSAANEDNILWSMSDFPGCFWALQTLAVTYQWKIGLGYLQ